MAMRGLILLVGLLLVAPASVRGDGPLSGFDPFVAAVMAEWQVPGMVVGAVRGDALVLARAYGTVDAEGTAPVTGRTLFHLGSITKSFTVAGLGLLADEGRLDWDAPVRTYIPEFALIDPRATRDVTVRHLVTHTTGLPRHDVLWYADAFRRDELLRRLRHLALTAAPGTRFQYSNLTYMVAGAVAGRIAGTPWEAFTRDRLLRPLGMNDTRLSIAAFRASGRAARPYILTSRGRVPVALRDTDPIAPAGAVYSNLADMIRYLSFHVGDGRGLLRRKTAAAMRTARVEAPDDLGFVEFSGSHYGMGFFVTRYRGERLVHHPGVINGYKGRLTLLPDRNLGVVVLSNLSGRNRAPAIVTLALIDRLLGLEPIDWASRFRAAGQTARARALDRKTRAKRASLRPPDPAPPVLTLGAYAGRFEHPGYGWIDVGVDAGRRNGLTGSFNGKPFALVHVDGEVWRVGETTWPIRRGLKVTFVGDGQGGIGALRAAIADGPTYRFTIGDVTFRRKSE